MKTTPRNILSVTILCLYGFTFTGCNKEQQSSTPTTIPISLNEPDGHNGHDHADDHDHPAHGPRGGHMIELSDGANVEWLLDDEAELLSVMLDNTDKVSKVEMKTTIEGTETVYEFERTDTPDGPVWGLKSPELATAVKMGETVPTELVITRDEAESTGKVEYHAH